MQKACKPLRLVGLEHVHPECRRHHQHDHDRRHGEDGEREEVLPGGARHEQHHESDDGEHHGRAQVRLGQYQQRRDQRQEDDPYSGTDLVQPSRAVCYEGRQRQDEEDLAELRGLHLEQGQRNPAVRTLHGRHPQHDQDQRDHQAVEAVLVLAQPRVRRRHRAGVV